MAYIVDAIINNPGAAGGVLTTRKGELIGLIGKELRNTLTDTWVNYAMPINELTDFATKAMHGDYKPIARPEEKKLDDKKAFHGIVLVPDVLASGTPPYVEEVMPGSPAAQAGIKVDDLIVFLACRGTMARMRWTKKLSARPKLLKKLSPPSTPALRSRSSSAAGTNCLVWK